MARVMVTAVDGTTYRPPWISRVIAFVFKPLLRRWLLETGMPTGIPHKGIRLIGEVREADAFFPDGRVTDAGGLAELRTAIRRYKSADELHPHVAFGEIGREGWDRFNLRHAELHLSFVVPNASAREESI